MTTGVGHGYRQTTFGGFAMRRALGIAAALGLAAAAASAQDIVYLAAGEEGQTRIAGLVLDYTGRELQIRLPDGRQQRIAAEQVLRIETEYGARHLAAYDAFAEKRFDEALALYRQAAAEEPRRWVRRQIVARWVWCYQALGQTEAAGDAFLLLMRDDPSTPYFDAIPLAWMPRQPPAALEQAARRWIDRDEPAAALLGASHLLGTREHGAALAKLRELTLETDRRIAELATAQTWRAAAATADDAELDAWQRMIDSMPERLQAGPYFVLGGARAHRRQWEQAALGMLRVAILHAEHRALAAQALLEAGRSLEKLEKPHDAARLYRELIRTYPGETRPAAEAQSRIEDMAGRD